MRFRSSPLVDHNAPVVEEIKPITLYGERHGADCNCESCQWLAEEIRMRMKIKGTWGELV